MKTYLHIGGLVAAGFDPSGAYLLTITHSGRGVFRLKLGCGSPGTPS